METPAAHVRRIAGVNAIGWLDWMSAILWIWIAAGNVQSWMKYHTKFPDMYSRWEPLSSVAFAALWLVILVWRRTRPGRPFATLREGVLVVKGWEDEKRLELNGVERVGPYQSRYLSVYMKTGEVIDLDLRQFSRAHRWQIGHWISERLDPAGSSEPEAVRPV